MHEAFNMGLDPSVDASAFIQDVKEGELRHSENLWPDKKDWQGADVFVSLACLQRGVIVVFFFSEG